MSLFKIKGPLVCFHDEIDARQKTRLEEGAIVFLVEENPRNSEEIKLYFLEDNKILYANTKNFEHFSEEL